MNYLPFKQTSVKIEQITKYDEIRNKMSTRKCERQIKYVNHCFKYRNNTAVEPETIYDITSTL